MALQNPAFFLKQESGLRNISLPGPSFIWVAILGQAILGTMTNDETPQFIEYPVCHAK